MNWRDGEGVKICFLLCGLGSARADFIKLPYQQKKFRENPYYFPFLGDNHGGFFIKIN